jgi:5-methylthioribose kinase
VLGAGVAASAVVLDGGVSGATFLVDAEGERYVVKQPLPYLSVADVWPARLERAGIEAEALGVLGALTPDHVPRLVDYDPERFVVTMVAAPSSWVEWRAALLHGTVDIGVGKTLGHVLGTWHAATRDDPAVLERFGDLGLFVELRGDPYHRTVAERCPDLAGPVLACLDELLAERHCLVHGDFSPKNVLVGADGGVWVLDHEVTHAGNPVFDVAFLLHHLVMKTVHLGARDDTAPPLVRACARAFVDAYAAAGGPATGADDVVRHTGALLLARVHGKSRATYLTPEEAARVSLIGAQAVRGELASVEDLF